jgi:hypothetical protein
MLIQQNWYGLIPFIWGGLMFLGYKELSGSQPREEAIIMLFGRRTKTRVRGLILILDWLPIDIISVSVFNMQIDDRDIEITAEKSIRAADGVRMIGRTSIALQARSVDLDKFDDAKSMDGIFAVLDEMVPTCLKSIAKTENINEPKERGYKWMEDNNSQVSMELKALLENTDEQNIPGGITTLGVDIVRLRVILRPLSDKIVEADQDYIVEMLERKAEETDTETINKQIAKRLEAYKVWAGTDPAKISQIPSMNKLREEIVFERLAKDKRVTIVQGGRNVNLNSIGNTNQQGTP